MAGRSPSVDVREVDRCDGVRSGARRAEHRDHVPDTTITERHRWARHVRDHEPGQEHCVRWDILRRVRVGPIREVPEHDGIRDPDVVVRG